MGKVLIAHVHVADEAGVSHAFAPGDKLPKWAEERVTNPAAFESASGKTATDETTAVAAAAAGAAESSIATAAAAAAATGTGESTPPATTPPVDPPAGEPTFTEYAGVEFKALQTEAKHRGLSGAGNTEALVARLTADDRDRANVAAQAILDAAAGSSDNTQE